MLDEQSVRANLAPAPLSQLDPKQEQNYRPVTVQGRWDSRYFLLENRVNKGRPGYEVLALFMANDQNVLVNRGWVQGSLDRTLLPEVNFESDELVLNGYAYRSKSKPFTLGEPVWTDTWPERIQSIDWQQIQSRLDDEIYPYLVRLNSASNEALVTGWPVVNLPPRRHVGYAIQWFALATALLILTLIANSNFGVLVKYRFGKNID